MKLITLSGQDRAIDALLEINPRKLDDYAAGLVFLSLAARFYPGLQWRDILQPEQLGGSWLGDQLRSIGNTVSDTTSKIYDGIKTVMGDIKDGIGDIGGSTIRLVADEEVQQGVVRGVTAYATGGQSLATEGVLSSIFGTGNESGQRLVVEQAGASYKNILGGIPIEYFLIGGGALLLILIIAMR